MAVSPSDLEADRALKRAHRSMWALGDYPQLAAAVIPDLGSVLVEASGVAEGARVLDVAAGSGNVAIPAALAGARVVACDLTPELLDAGRREAERRGVSIDWEPADAEALPFGDGEFDAVLSCVGVMFAPHHRRSADELLRVCRPGGTIGLVSWTPEGFVGQMLAAMRPFVPPPPPGSLPPVRWGDEDHVRDLLGDRVEGLVAERRTVSVACFADAEAFRDGFKSRYGPTVAAYRAIAGDREKVMALDEALVELARRHDRGAAGTVMDWEYLLVTARAR